MSVLPMGGFQLPFQKRLSRLYNDTKKSTDFVKEPIQNAENPEIKVLHRKLRIQKDRLVSWGLEWSDPNQSEIDESLSEAGLSEIVGSIMSTIKDILAEAEPLWQSSKRLLGGEVGGFDGSKAPGDRKVPLVAWDKSRFEDLVNDLTTSIDTLYDLSRTRSSAAMSAHASGSRMFKSTRSTEEMRAFESSRMQTPQQIDPALLTRLDSTPVSSSTRPDKREIVFMSKQAWAKISPPGVYDSYAPLLLEYAPFDSIYSNTGIMPPMARFEKLSAGLQTEPQRSPGTWSGLPRVVASFEDLENSRLGLVYRFPPGFQPLALEEHVRSPMSRLCTLGDLLSRPNFEPRLEAKYRLAHNLANTVFDMHARGITHGNFINTNLTFSDSISHLVPTAGNKASEPDVRRPLISSFELFPDSFTEDPSASKHVLYRHPLDPRTTVQSPLNNRTDLRVLDLYSLAMILVEIGLWTKLENLVPDPSSPSIPENVLDQLAIRCGTLYMKAVQVCWNAVDQELTSERGNEKGSEDLLSEVQARASRYLETCCIIDGVSGLEDRIRDDSPSGAKMSKSGLADSSSSAVFGQSMSGFSPFVLKSSAAAAMYPPKVDPVPKTDSPISAQPMTTALREKPGVDEGGVQGVVSGISKEQPKLRLYPQVPLPPEVVEKWNTVVMPQVNAALRQFYRKHPESVEISLESIGPSPTATKPTVLVVCTSVNKVRTILNRKLADLFDGPMGFALKVCKGKVLRSRKRTTRPRRSVAGETDDPLPAANPEFQERPNNGASIGAWVGDRHLPPVSFGGLVIIDDKPYGMTVHHMLDDPDVDQVPTEREPAVWRSAWHPREDYSTYSHSGESSSADDYACEFSDSDSESYSATELSSDDDESEKDDDFDDDEGDEDMFEAGDIPGVEPGCGEGYIVTQPALDDIEDGFYPFAETEDEDHLDSFALGEVYASSGIRRRSENGLVHEIDWALFEFHGARQPSTNIVPRTLGTNKTPFASRALRPTRVAPVSALPGLKVRCIARTSGAQSGTILPALTSVKIYGRTSPSHTYQVTSSLPEATPFASAESRNLTPLGVPGDSGAWLVDAQEGRVCGHVLAWSQRKKVAYICPMDILMRDMLETLEANEIRLPGGEDDGVFSAHRSRGLGDGVLSRDIDMRGLSRRIEGLEIEKVIGVRS